MLFYSFKGNRQILFYCLICVFFALACSKTEEAKEEINIAQLKQASLVYYAMPG